MVALWVIKPSTAISKTSDLRTDDVEESERRKEDDGADWSDFLRIRSALLAMREMIMIICHQKRMMVMMKILIMMKVMMMMMITQVQTWQLEGQVPLQRASR